MVGWDWTEPGFRRKLIKVSCRCTFQVQDDIGFLGDYGSQSVSVSSSVPECIFGNCCWCTSDLNRSECAQLLPYERQLEDVSIQPYVFDSQVTLTLN